MALIFPMFKNSQNPFQAGKFRFFKIFACVTRLSQLIGQIEYTENAKVAVTMDSSQIFIIFAANLMAFRSHFCQVPNLWLTYLVLFFLASCLASLPVFFCRELPSENELPKIAFIEH